ncbi:MAG: allantoinase [Chthoniobacter sp.]|jgi:allantoinase|nr:allantoinase [Chthoniobacter sp.]
MPEFDLLIRGAANVPALGIAGGRIAALAEGTAREEIDATGLLLLPGVIDAHVHFNEPGRADWEGIATGSRACAAGGTTTFFDMPLNAHPPTCDAASFDLKRAAMERAAFVDFALWGGLVPGNRDDLEPLRDRGVIGLKAFMAGSGIDDFPRVDLPILRAGMKRAAGLGLMVAVHAEFDRPELQRGWSWRHFVASRPIESELAAIQAAVEIAGETGCALHIVHVSSAAGVDLVTAARARGVDVTCETCPHYLVLNEEDLDRLGAVAKCAPPLRPETERRALLARLRAGEISTVGSDHSPSPWSMKSDTDFFKIWGGISGCQHLLVLLFDLELEPELIARLTASNVASRFRIPQKGCIVPGANADLVLVDPKGQTEVTSGSLRYRHPHSPYGGQRLRGRVVRTLLRGRTICLEDRLIGEPRGRLVNRRS